MFNLILKNKKKIQDTYSVRPSINLLFHLIAQLLKEINNNTLIFQGICSASNSAIRETASDIFLHPGAILILRFARAHNDVFVYLHLVMCGKCNSSCLYYT